MRAFACAVPLIVLTATVPARAQQGAVAVIDLQRAIAETEDGLRATAALRSLHVQHQADLDRRAAELQRIRASLERGGGTEVERQRLSEQYRVKVEQLQALYVRYQLELGAEEARQTARILQQIRTVIEEIRRARGYSVVIELNPGQPPPSGAGAAADITEDVISRHDERFDGPGSPRR